MSETQIYRTPAADALQFERDDLKATIAAVAEDETVRLNRLSADEVRAEAERLFDGIKKSASKKRLVEAIAVWNASQSDEGKRLEALTVAANREASILRAITDAEAEVQYALGRVQAAVEKGDPAIVLDRTVAWQTAIAAARQWRVVGTVLSTTDYSPEEALVRVARQTVWEILSDARSGPRSSSPTRNIISQAQTTGQYGFLRKAARYSADVAELVRW